MKKTDRNKMFFILFIGFAIIFYRLFINLGEYLVISETPKDSDVIVVLSGEDGRLQQGAKLYKGGFAKFTLLTNSTVRFSTVDEAIAFGIPKSKILKEERATSTYTNAIYTKEILEQENLESVIVVTSDFHMRRTKLIFNRVFKNTDIQLLYISSDTSWFNKDQWWKDNLSKRVVIHEWIKIVGYQLYLYKWIDIEN